MEYNFSLPVFSETTKEYVSMDGQGTLKRNLALGFVFAFLRWMEIFTWAEGEGGDVDNARGAEEPETD